MATLMQPKSENELKGLSVTKLRPEYMRLADTYLKLLDSKYVYCPKCGNWYTSKAFYQNPYNADNIEHWGCIKCITKAGTDYDKKTDTYTDNKEKAKRICRTLDWVFIEKIYDDQVQAAIDKLGEKNRSTGFQQYVVMIRSLPQYKSLHWEDSKFIIGDDSNPEDQREIKKVIQSGKKRFGSDYSNQDLMFLENEYKDWVTRYECNTKAQEEIFKNLSTNRLERKQAVKQGKPTKEIDKTFQELLAAQNIQPRQTGMDAFADAQTLGTLLQKYEETRPLPEIDPELQDVDKIGLYIDAFYRGHTSKMLGLKNTFSHIYEKVMKKYTVERPEYDEYEDSEVIFEKVFGSVSDE